MAANSGLARRSTANQKFSGKASGYPAWKSHIIMNAAVDHMCWNSEFARMAWVRGLIEGDAANMVSRGLSNGPIGS